MLRTRQGWALAGLIALGAGLRFVGLDQQSLWYDEAYTANLVNQGFAQMLDRIPQQESTPPLYYATAWVWTQVLGSGEVGLRSLSALVGTATIPVGYAAGRELRSPRVGLAVAALAATNPFLIWYSQEARAYSLLVFLGALSLWLFARVRRSPSTAGILWWAVACAVALATHYFAVFVVAPQAALLLRDATMRRQVLVALAGIAAVGLLLLTVALDQPSLSEGSFISQLALGRRLIDVPKQLVLGYDSPAELIVTAIAAVVVLAGIVLAVQLLRKPRSAGLLACMIIAASGLLVPVALVVVGADYFYGRNVIATWPSAAIVVSAGLLSVRWGTLGVIVLCVIGIASVVGVMLDARWQRQDWRGIAEAAGPADTARAIVAQPGGARVPLRLYFGDSYRAEPCGRRLAEILVVAPISPTGTGSHSGPPPRPTSLVTPGGFDIVERRFDDSFSLVRYRAGSATRVNPGALDRLALDPDRSQTVFFQCPPRSSAARPRRLMSRGARSASTVVDE